MRTPVSGLRLSVRNRWGESRRLTLSLLLAALFIANRDPRSALLFASGPGSTTGELLKIPVGSRAIGMGEAYTALADDSYALAWNPAGMAFAQQKEAAF